MSSPQGISVVLPVHNGARWLERVVTAIETANWNGPLEIVAIDDGSTDGSRDILQRRAAGGRLRLLDGERRGAAAAMNLGIRAAAHPLIAQIDQDVVIAPDWMERLATTLADPTVAAAQGHYVAARDAGLWSRVMALDLRQRYDAIGPWTNHVCTGNSIYRTSALVDAGLFDESLGYGYDNDMSYRLTQAGYRLAFCADAASTHEWREGLMDYARQQYGFGYGRLDLVAKHRRRIAGDDVSRATMMLHGPVMGAAIAAIAVAIGFTIAGVSSRAPLVVAAVLLAILCIERLIAGVRAARTFGDNAGFWFVPVHLVRDFAWAAAIVMWIARRLTRSTPRPSDSMWHRSAGKADD